MNHASRFFNQHVANLDGMSPNDGLVNDGAKCLAQRGIEYAIYVKVGVPSVTVDLSAVVGESTAAFYDPLTGSLKSPMRVTGGGFRSFSTPDSGQDWALLIRASHGKGGVGGEGTE